MQNLLKNSISGMKRSSTKTRALGARSHARLCKYKQKPHQVLFFSFDHTCASIPLPYLKVKWSIFVN